MHDKYFNDLRWLLLTRWVLLNQNEVGMIFYIEANLLPESWGELKCFNSQQHKLFRSSLQRNAQFGDAQFSLIFKKNPRIPPVSSEFLFNKNLNLLGWKQFFPTKICLQSLLNVIVGFQTYNKFSTSWSLKLRPPPWKCGWNF